MNLTDFVTQLDRELETFGINTNGTPEAVLVECKGAIRAQHQLELKIADLEKEVSAEQGSVEKLSQLTADLENDLSEANKENDKLSDRINELLAELEALKSERDAA